jgi:hypothetical protein
MTDLENREHRTEAAASPVFVDVSGRRRRSVRHAGYVVACACIVYIALIGLSLSDTTVGPLKNVPAAQVQGATVDPDLPPLADPGPGLPGLLTELVAPVVPKRVVPAKPPRTTAPRTTAPRATSPKTMQRAPAPKTMQRAPAPKTTPRSRSTGTRAADFSVAAGPAAARVPDEAL